MALDVVAFVLTIGFAGTGLGVLAFGAGIVLLATDGTAWGMEMAGDDHRAKYPEFRFSRCVGAPMSRLLNDQPVTTPSQIRLHVCGIALPSTFGLTSAGMTTYLCFLPDDDENSIAIGFVLAAVFLGFAQMRTRAALQTIDHDKRISLLTGLRNLHALAIGFAVTGFVITERSSCFRLITGVPSSF